jgi:hypothetical protein
VSTAAPVALNHDTHVKNFRNAQKEFKNSEYGIQLTQIMGCQGLEQKSKGCHVTTPKSQGAVFKIKCQKEQKTEKFE